MSQPDTCFLEEVWARLYSVMELQGTKDMFVKEADLKRVWNEVPAGQQQSRLGLLVRNLYDLPPDDATAATWLSSLEHRFLKVISILVHISWDKWKDFLQIFVGDTFDPTTPNQKSRADSDLPFADRTTLTSDNFLGPRYGLTFYEFQYIFIPIKIGNWLAEKDNHSIKTLRFRTRLPVLETKEIGHGASGNVFIETIAPGYFRIEDGWNTKPKQIARKSITTQDKFDVETGNVMQIQSCLSTHDNIAKCYDMVVRQSAHKTRYDMFYELASFDLRKLFNGPLDSGDGYRTYSEENPGHFEGIEFWHLLQQAECLADALHSLHDESYHPDEGKVCLAHNDLKPDNILVFYQPKSPVGIWKIADLGLSRIKSGIPDDSFEQDGTSGASQLNLQRPAAKFAPTYAKRPPGAYTAPESQNGRRVDPYQGDIWSFGCILSEILAFAIGGTQTLREFNDLRYDHEDRFYERCDQSPTGYRLKQKVFNWLSNIHVQYPTVGLWATECVDLIFHIWGIHDANANSRHDTTGWILFLDGQRPKAREIRDKISLIKQTERGRQSLASDTSISGSLVPSIDPQPGSSSASIGSRDSGPIATKQFPTPRTSISRGTSASSWDIGLSDPRHSSSIKILNRGMPNTKISPNAKYIGFWSNAKAVFLCLASLDFVTGNDAHHSPRCEVSPPGSLRCEAIAFWGDQAAITYRGSGAVEV
ncbi:kinase-like domain-containing protein [Delphinella strobiligena]|nr:kinase-like domain-containing protein [Delphinella strobiligena]